MEISDRLKEIIKFNEQELDNLELQSIYKDLRDYPAYDAADTENFTQLLYNIGIDPLKYLVYIPCDYMFQSDYSGDIHVPENVRSIGFRAFFKATNIKNIYVPNTIEEINSYAFPYCKCNIIYDGTMEEFNEIFDIRREGAVNKDLTIITSDATQIYNIPKMEEWDLKNIPATATIQYVNGVATPYYSTEEMNKILDEYKKIEEIKTLPYTAAYADWINYRDWLGQK